MRRRTVYRTVRASSDARNVPSEGQTRITLDERGALITLISEERPRGVNLSAQLRRRVTRVKRTVSRSSVAVAQRAPKPLVAPITTGAKRASHAQLRARGDDGATGPRPSGATLQRCPPTCTRTPGSGWDRLPECLTAAEAEVARLALEGLSNELIADRRAVRVRTVSNQLASVFLKLGVRTRAELAFLIASGSQERP